jgi:large subunit ribosomal protein L25
MPLFPGNLAIADHLVYRRPVRADTLGGNADGIGNGLRSWQSPSAPPGLSSNLKGKAMSHASYELKAVARERVGKGSSRELRRNGLIPAVIYGDKQAPISISINTNEITKRIHAGGFLTTVAVIDVNGEKIRVLPKDYQLDPVRDFTMHIDFLRVSANSQVSVQVPVHFVNEEKSAIKTGGVLNIVRHEVELHCPASDIPEFITVDLAGLKVGDSVHISAVKLPAGVTPVIDRDFTIATIVAPAGGMEEEAAEA